MINRILLAVDGSDRDGPAFLEARRIAGRGSEIHLLHVVPSRAVPVGTPLPGMMEAGPDVPLASGATGAEGHLHAFPSSYPEAAFEGESQLQDQAGRYLADLRKREGDVPGQDIVWTGATADSILDVALKFNVDMIVMSRHARTRFSRWLLGSVTDTVLKRSQLPVLLVRGAGSPQRLQRVVVPLDGTRESRAILAFVTPLAARLNAEILLLEIVKPDESWRGSGDVCHDLTLSGSAWQFAMAHGDPAELILRHAEARNADLIALSMSERGGGGRLDKAVVEAVLGGCDLPVLLQHPVIHAH